MKILNFKVIEENVYLKNNSTIKHGTHKIIIILKYNKIHENIKIIMINIRTYLLFVYLV